MILVTAWCSRGSHGRYLLQIGCLPVKTITMVTATALINFQVIYRVFRGSSFIPLLMRGARSSLKSSYFLSISRWYSSCSSWMRALLMLSASPHLSVYMYSVKEYCCVLYVTRCAKINHVLAQKLLHFFNFVLS